MVRWSRLSPCKPPPPSVGCKRPSSVGGPWPGLGRLQRRKPMARLTLRSERAAECGPGTPSGRALGGGPGPAVLLEEVMVI